MEVLNYHYRRCSSNHKGVIASLSIACKQLLQVDLLRSVGQLGTFVPKVIDTVTTTNQRVSLLRRFSSFCLFAAMVRILSLTATLAVGSLFMSSILRVSIEELNVWTADSPKCGDEMWALPSSPPLSSHRCAIALYGLPRAFKSLVLPSLIQNVIIPNEEYKCDYFVQFHKLERERSGRSGAGGILNVEARQSHRICAYHRRRVHSKIQSLFEQDPYYR